jgi:hypothetical protein
VTTFSIGWVNAYSESSYQNDAEPSEWVRVEAADERAPVTRIIADAETTQWASEWLDDARRQGDVPSPYWLAVRFGSGATLQRVMPDGSLRGWDELDEITG